MEKFNLLKTKNLFNRNDCSLAYKSSRKVLHKENKYNSIKQQIKFENPEYEVGQVTLVMDSFGGFYHNLRKNIEKVLSDKLLVQKIITNMQKSIISSAAHLARRCKINFL